MPGSIRLGRIWGIEVGFHWSWFLIFVYFTWAFAAGVLEHFFPGWTDAQKWIIGGLLSLIFFGSLLAHELAHSFVARARGIDVKGITLFLFGGVSNLSGEPKTAKDEFLIAIVGPLTSLLMGAIFGLGWFVIDFWSPAVAGVSAQLAVINAAIAVFNLIPGFPLDGGRVFRAIVWGRNRNQLSATRIASHVGEGVAYALMAGGVVFFLTTGDFVAGIWLLVIGLFLRGMATASYQQLVTDTALKGVKASEVASGECQLVPPDLSLQQMVDDYVLARNIRCFPVAVEGNLLGLVTLDDVRKVPREEWPTTSVYRAMTPYERLHSVPPDEDVSDVAQLMAREDVNQVPIIEGRRLLGLISRGDILRFIQVRRDLAEKN